ncbi:MAG: hypothetical protein IJS61_05885 [Firmicutes bacterium]|nr:hypothetical protein [Bacillota bacterium]
MSEVRGNLYGKCPGCGNFNRDEDYVLVSYGTSVDASSNNYSIGKGIIGGLLFGPVGTVAGFSHSSGSLKSKRMDTYKCKHCGELKHVQVSTFY